MVDFSTKMFGKMVIDKFIKTLKPVPKEKQANGGLSKYFVLKILNLVISRQKPRFYRRLLFPLASICRSGTHTRLFSCWAVSVHNGGFQDL